MWIGSSHPSHFQGAVSAGLSLMKPDIMTAFKDFIFCQREVADVDGGNHRASLFGGFSRFSAFANNPNVISGRKLDGSLNGSMFRSLSGSIRKSSEATRTSVDSRVSGQTAPRRGSTLGELPPIREESEAATQISSFEAIIKETMASMADENINLDDDDDDDDDDDNDKNDVENKGVPEQALTEIMEESCTDAPEDDGDDDDILQSELCTENLSNAEQILLLQETRTEEDLPTSKNPSLPSDVVISDSNNDRAEAHDMC